MLMTTQGAQIQEELLFSHNGGPLIIPDNPPWNYQLLYPLGPGINLSSGDILRIEGTGESDTDVGDIKVFVVDLVDGHGWKVLSGNHSLCTGIKGRIRFTTARDVRITTTSGGNHIHLALVIDYQDAEFEPNLTFSRFTVTRIYR